MPPIDALDLAHTGSPVEPTCLHHDRLRLLYSYGIQQIERAYSNVARRGLQTFWARNGCIHLEDPLWDTFIRCAGDLEWGQLYRGSGHMVTGSYHVPVRIRPAQVGEKDV